MKWSVEEAVPLLTVCVCRRRHLYGDIYSSPGLSLAQKQILMVAFLGEANMHEQLFGHLLAVCILPHQYISTASFADGSGGLESDKFLSGSSPVYRCYDELLGKVHPNP